MALLNDGSVYSWGRNNNGQLADGTMLNQLSPKQIFENIMEVACGVSFTIFITHDGDFKTVGKIFY